MDAVGFDDYGFLISREDQDGLVSRSAHDYRFDFYISMSIGVNLKGTQTTVD